MGEVGPPPFPWHVTKMADTSLMMAACHSVLKQDFPLGTVAGPESPDPMSCQAPLCPIPTSGATAPLHTKESEAEPHSTRTKHVSGSVAWEGQAE